MHGKDAPTSQPLVFTSESNGFVLAASGSLSLPWCGWYEVQSFRRGRETGHCSNITKYGDLVWWRTGLFMSKMTRPCRPDLLVWQADFADSVGFFCFGKCCLIFEGREKSTKGKENFLNVNILYKPPRFTITLGLHSHPVYSWFAFQKYKSVPRGGQHLSSWETCSS